MSETNHRIQEMEPLNQKYKEKHILAHHSQMLKTKDEEKIMKEPGRKGVLCTEEQR